MQKHFWEKREKNDELSRSSLGCNASRCTLRSTYVHCIKNCCVKCLAIVAIVRSKIFRNHEQNYSNKSHWNWILSRWMTTVLHLRYSEYWGYAHERMSSWLLSDVSVSVFHHTLCSIDSHFDLKTGFLELGYCTLSVHLAISGNRCTVQQVMASQSVLIICCSLMCTLLPVGSRLH